ncbi:hypothetical protein AB1Y20_000548 [Prymnesium parvum]|uniref:UV excision repair protein RAD23 n=1 Tax=Prymnesium parvum TaxID=97485 RepID=A0AB34K5L8_PRYPA
MKCKLKTLKGDAFEVDVEGGTLVKAVKDMAAASEHGVKGGWEAEGIKLIFQGKVLEDTKDLAHYSIGDGDFMVVMAAKPKKPAAAPAEPAAAEAAPAPAPAEQPAAQPTPTPLPAAQARSEFSAEAQAAIDNLVDMGYARPHVQAAMLAAFMNPDRAVQYLEEGLPTEMDADYGGDDDGGDEPVPSTWEELAASASFRAEVAGIRDQAALQAYVTGLQTSDPNKLRLIQSNPEAFATMLNQAQAAAAAGGAPAPVAPAAAPLPFGTAAPAPGGGRTLPPELQQLQQILANPQMVEGLMQNPEMLQQLLQVPEVQEMLQSPELMAQLGVHPEMMQAMLQGVMGGGGMGPGMAANAVQAQLNEEDEEAIQRLMALGFPRGVAFLACEKNENLAANFLFDQGADLM